MTLKIRPIRIEGNVAYVPLTKGYEAVIDVADAPLVDGFNWRALVKPNATYAKRNGILMHRLIMGYPDGLQVDHIDLNGLNNRRNNLREATPSQNQHNQRVRRSNSSGFKGVSWNKSARKWGASITLNGRKKHLGYFTELEDAHASYCAASAEYHVEFGRIK